MSSYKNYVGKNPLQNYEHLIIPVHLPTEEHWLLAIISIISLCIYIYDSANFPENTYKSIFETLKQKFIKRERQTLSPQQYRDPPTPRDGNCMFHAISDQLARLGLALKTPSELRSNVVQYLRNNPLTSDGTHLREFISYQAWESYLRRMSQEGVWGDWITLWGLVNMLDIDVAVVSSIGEGGLRVISPGDTSNSDHNLNRTALLGHEAEEHHHSLDNVTTLSAKKGADPVDYTKNKYGEGKVLEEICPKCCKKFKCLSAGIYDDESGIMQYYADDCYLCDVCSKEEEWYSY